MQNEDYVDMLEDNGFFSNEDNVSYKEPIGFKIETYETKEIVPLRSNIDRPESKTIFQTLAEAQDDVIGLFCMIVFIISVILLIPIFALGATVGQMELWTFLILGIVTGIFGPLCLFGDNIASALYSICNHLTKKTNFYVVTYTGILPARFDDVLFYANEPERLRCQVAGMSESQNICISDVARTKSDAINKYWYNQARRRGVLVKILGTEKTELFLNSSLYKKYADLYYENYYFLNCKHYSAENFLTTESDVIDFFVFIRETNKSVKEAEERDKQRQKNTQSLIDETLNLI